MMTGLDWWMRLAFVLCAVVGAVFVVLYAVDLIITGAVTAAWTFCK